MMHNNGLIVAIKDQNNKVLREVKSDSGMAVFLEFYTDYSIYLKNNNDRTAVAKVEVDGTDILGGSQIIIRPGRDATVSRFCVNGDLNAGNKLHFVPQNDSRVSDPSSSENGLVKVTFTLEKEIYYRPDNQVLYDFRDCCLPPTKTFYNYSTNTSASNQPISWDCSATVDSCSTSFNQPLSCKRERGATVEGKKSGQIFSYGSVKELENVSTVITLQMRGRKDSCLVNSAEDKENKEKQSIIRSLSKLSKGELSDLKSILNKLID